MAELADTSAWFAARRSPSLSQTFEDLLLRREIASCDATMFELLYTARNGPELSVRRAELEQLPWCPIGPREWRRALDVYEALAHQGGMHHRRVTHPDLLIAAAAESADMTLLHYDADFEVIAALTGQSIRWIAQRGSL